MVCCNTLLSRQNWRALRITSLLSFILIAHASAHKGLAQDKVNLSFKNAPIKKVFREIHRQTGYTFAYEESVILKAKPVSVALINVPLSQALTACFKGQPFTYEIQDKIIMLRERPAHDQKPLTANVMQDTIPRVLIKGKILVSDSSRTTLSDVTVINKSTGHATASDESGLFSLPARKGDVLQLTHVGMETTRFVVYSTSDLLNITMTRNIVEEAAVQVYSTGYQNLPRERATGSFTKIDNELLNRSVGSNILDRLDGVTNSLIMFPESGEEARSGVGGSRQIQIRGISTLESNQNPLIVLDNFPFYGDINAINPNDIESVTILKDAASASIWGARSGNGVIVITTKQGAYNQKLNIDFNANVSISDKPDIFYDRNYIPTPDYIDMEKYLFAQGYFNNDIYNVIGRPPLTPVVEILAKLDAGQITQSEADSQINALQLYDVRQDKMKYVYRKAVNQQYSLHLSGGSNIMSYNFSIGYDKNLKQTFGSNFDRMSINGYTTYRPIKNLELSTGILYTSSRVVNNRLQTFASTGKFQKMYPYARFTDDDGNASWIVKDYRANFLDSVEALGFLDWRYRPLDEMKYADNRTSLGNIILKTKIKYNIFQFLNVELQYQNERQTTYGRYLESEKIYSTRNLINKYTQRDVTTGTLSYPFPKGDLLTITQDQLLAHSLRGLMHYNHHFGEHTIAAIIGTELRQIKTEGYNRTFYGYEDEFGSSVANINFQTSYPTNPSGSSVIPNYNSGYFAGTTQRQLSYFFNAGYTYQSKYTLSVSARKDGENIFGVLANQKIVPLWSSGVSWLISKESFYQARWLPVLKLRFTFGFNGNVGDGSGYLIAAYRSSDALTGLPYATIASPGNPEISWERVRNINLGLDFGLINNALTGSIELYKKDGMDLIEGRLLAPSTGFEEIRGNAANTRTVGIDFILNGAFNFGAIKYQPTLIFNFIKDKVVKYDHKYSTAILVSNLKGIPYEQKPISALYSYRWAGIDPNTGDPLGYLDGAVSKDYLGIFNNATIDNIVVHGSNIPRIFGSFRNTLSYKNFSISANIIYKLDYYFRRQSTSLNYTEAYANPHYDYTLRWQKSGDELHTQVPSLVYTPNANRNKFYQSSSVLVERGDHIRLKDIQFSFGIEKSQRPWLPISHLKFYCYINNIGLLWKSNDKGLDPDSSNAPFVNPKIIAIGIQGTL